MIHETCYVSTNCNQTPNAVSWGKNNLICYAASNAVLIYNPKYGSGGKVIHTLVHHSNRVNSVRWIRGRIPYENELVSGSTDHTAIVWSNKDGKYTPHVLKGHESNVNIVDGLYKEQSTIVVTASMDSTVKIWIREKKQDFVNVQTIDYGYSICVSLSISSLPKTGMVLACALDNSTIVLYSHDDQFIQSATLKGHEDWVRGLDFTTDDKGDLILASSSQDHYIRLWRITLHHLTETNFEDSFKTKHGDYKIYVDSVLTGHEGWIYSVNWNPQSAQLQLLSASLDKSMIIWEFDPGSNLWLEKIRLGEVGGNTLGFYGGVFSPDGCYILGYSYHGAFHVWKNNNSNWEPSVTVGGHFGVVNDLSWEPKGEFLVSVSSDQTTRIHAPWRKDHLGTWHEVARPQIHGYDLSSIALISRYKFASSAEEKVIRTFKSPRNFIDNFKRICRIDEFEGDEDSEAKGASVPSLGLSNKAVYLNDTSEHQEDFHFTEVTLTEPPTEETLLQNTLWPEIQKLYGHGYEVYSLAASPDGQYLASACKATTPEHAAILIWDTTSWKQIQKLVSHTLTVVQMCFSPNSEHLLSVSRDRRWSLFSKNHLGQFELVATTDKKTSIHTRIIWCCAWSHDSKYFATGSRDGKVVVWTRNEDKPREGILGEYEAVPNHLDLKSESVTAVAFAPGIVLERYLVAVGLETGTVHLYTWLSDGWQEVLLLDKSLAHHLTVKRLSFRPVFGTAGDDNVENILQLASCSADNSVKIHNIKIK